MLTQQPFRRGFPGIGHAACGFYLLRSDAAVAESAPGGRSDSGSIYCAGGQSRPAPGHTVIAGWLYRAVHFAALNLQRGEARRKHWEMEAATMNNPSDDAPAEPANAFNETALPQVGDALAELAEKDRAALVLRFLQQKSLRDVGNTMGTSEEAAKKRVSRALEKLRSLLARRGMVVPAAALAIGLSQLPVFAAPAALRASLPAIVANAAIPASTFASALLARLLLLRAKLIAGFALIVLCGAVFGLWPRHLVTANGTPRNSPPLRHHDQADQCHGG